MQELTPRQLVAELDRYIVGQKEAKRAVAIAVRNRWRRKRLADDLQQEVTPKNILLIGSTGVGKTEIARRLAKLTGAPFVKVEATKFTEVGYVGRDVDAIIRDLLDNAIQLVRARERLLVEAEARERVAERLLDLLVPAPSEYRPAGDSEGGEEHERYGRTREKMRAKLAAGELEDRKVEVHVEQRSSPVMFSAMGMEQLDPQLQDMLEKMLPKQSSKRELTIAEARKVLLEEEVEQLLNRERIHAEAVQLAENLGIVFLDEIDKITASERSGGADVSRQGVQRDLLPLVEGTTVQTRHGPVQTDHILFIAAGAFHRSKPSDLMPELQGRFPIRVELTDLTKEDFLQILTEPKNSLTRQYAALLGTEGVELVFTPDGAEALAEYAYRLNQTTQNIGARRLATILERVLDELSFEAADMGTGHVEITGVYVRQKLEAIAKDEDLSRYIL